MPWRTSNILATRPLTPALSPADSGGEGAHRAGEKVRSLVCSILNATWCKLIPAGHPTDLLPQHRPQHGEEPQETGRPLANATHESEARQSTFLSLVLNVYSNGLFMSLMS